MYAELSNHSKTRDLGNGLEFLAVERPVSYVALARRIQSLLLSNKIKLFVSICRWPRVRQRIFARYSSGCSDKMEATREVKER